MQACGGADAVAQAADPADPIEGVWESVVTIRDFASGALQRTFKGEIVFHRGGTATGDNSLPPATRSTAFGTWKLDAPKAYTARFRFLRFNPDGTLAGAQRVQRTITLAADNNSLTGTVTAQVLDKNEAVLQSMCGSESTTRVS